MLEGARRRGETPTGLPPVQALRVLHVTECFEGGVSRAIRSRLDAMPEHEHHLLYTGDDAPGDLGFSSVERLPRGLVARVLATRRVVRELSPDVVHAHSSWAGVYSRLWKLSVPVVYEAHCYKFDDPHLRVYARRIFWLAEKILAKNTASVGVLSPHELGVAKSLSDTVPVTLIPNTPTVHPLETVDPAPSVSVGMIGRVSPQKDPAYLVAVTAHLRERLPAAPVRWIGGGTKVATTQLEEAGIHVTGWIDGDELVSEIDSLSVYAHTAAYEGFPLAVLDAAARRVPIVARRIPALEGTPLLLVDTPEEMAAAIAALLAEPGDRDEVIRRGDELLSVMDMPHLAASLRRLYEAALSSTNNHVSEGPQ